MYGSVPHAIITVSQKLSLMIPASRKSPKLDCRAPGWPINQWRPRTAAAAESPVCYKLRGRVVPITHNRGCRSPSQKTSRLLTLADADFFSSVILLINLLSCRQSALSCRQQPGRAGHSLSTMPIEFTFNWLGDRHFYQTADLLDAATVYRDRTSRFFEI